MSEEVKIDKELFSNRLSHLITIWKNDKRQSNDALFGGASSMVVLMGKNEEVAQLHKSNALHVSAMREPNKWLVVDKLQFWLLGYEFPATLMVFTLDALYVVTTPKKGTQSPLESLILFLALIWCRSETFGSSEGRQDTDRDPRAGQRCRREREAFPEMYRCY